MKKMAFSQSVLGKTGSIILALGLITSNISFAASTSKLEYTRNLVSGLGFEIEDASGAYKRETTNEENVIYTAFQMGLLKGVSWDFENPMTESEREIILGNAMAIYNQIHDTEDSKMVDDSNIQKSDSTVNVPDDIQWVTDYGTIKQPTDFNVNDHIWTDDEFHQYLTDGTLIDENILDVRLSNHHIVNGDSIYPYQTWYYDENTRKFMIKTGFLGEDENGYRKFYYDDFSNGIGSETMFQTMKDLCYHASLNNMNLYLHNTGGGQAYVTIEDRDNDGQNINLFLTYENGNRDYIYKDFNSYVVGETVIMSEWKIGVLFDMADLKQFGFTYITPSAEVTEMVRKIDYTTQPFVDTVYGVMDYMYGEDALDIYVEVMSNYLWEQETIKAMKVNATSKSYEKEYTNYKLYVFNVANTGVSYGFVNK